MALICFLGVRRAAGFDVALRSLLGCGSASLLGISFGALPHTLQGPQSNC